MHDFWISFFTLQLSLHDAPSTFVLGSWSVGGQANPPTGPPCYSMVDHRSRLRIESTVLPI